jgi:hypothetical protein
MKQLQFILDTLQQKHKGDRDVQEILLLSAVSKHHDFEVKLLVELNSGQCKTMAMEMMPGGKKYVY